MTKALLFSLAAAGALALGGCDRAGKGHHVDTAKEAADIKAQEAQWLKDYAAKNADALAAHYADDATMVEPFAALSATAEDRRKSILAMTEDPNFSLTFSAARVEVAKSGDLAYSRGPFTIRMTDKETGKPVTSSGTYLTVWQKRGDDWKAVEDVIVPGLPADAPTGDTAEAADATG